MSQYKDSDRYPIRCRECGKILAIRTGNRVVSSLTHRNRKKEIRICLEQGQRMTIVCEICGCDNQVIGN